MSDKKHLVWPQRKAYELAKTFTRVLNVVIVISIVTAVTQRVLSLFNGLDDVELILNRSSIIMMIVIAIFAWLSSYLRNTADEIRREALIDHSFRGQSKFANDEYFDTTGIAIGSEKLLANIHESCLFTRAISNKMLKRRAWKFALGCLLIVVFMLDCINSSFFYSIFPLFLSYFISSDWINLLILFTTTKSIEREAVSIWDLFDKDSDRKNNEKFNAIATQLAIRYECALTRANLILDEKVYLALKSDLNKKWISIREKYSF